MIYNYRPVLGFLYVLLFFSFVGMMLGQSVGHWLADSYGGWVTLEAFAGYLIYLGGLIWLIRRLSKAAGIEVSSTSSSLDGGMTEMEFIRSQRAADYAEMRPAEQAPEDGNGSKVKF